MVCERVLPFVTSMKIENGNKHILTNFSSAKDGATAKESDHKPLTMEVKLKIPSQKRVKVEIMNFTDKASQEAFKEYTSKTEDFTDCFKTMQSVLEQADNWINLVESYCKKTFKLIGIRTKNIKVSSADKLISERNKLIKRGCKDTSNLDAQIATIISKEGMKKATMFKKYTDTNMSGAVSQMWKLKKSLFPKKTSSLPVAKLNYQNQIISYPKDLTNLLGEEYGRIRLRKRPTHPLFVKEISIKKKIVKTKIQIASKKKTELFKMEDLEHVLKGIKGNKARDPKGISRIIFKNSIIGSNLKDSLLIFFNKLKIDCKIPEFMRKAVVTTIPKKGKKYH